MNTRAAAPPAERRCSRQGAALQRSRRCSQNPHASALPALPAASPGTCCLQQERHRQQGKGRSPYSHLHALAATRECSAAQTPAGFREGGEISSPGAGGSSGHTAGGSSPSPSGICSLKKRKHPKMTKTAWGRQLCGTIVEEIIIHKRTCWEQRKTWVCLARLCPAGSKARPLGTTRARTTYRIDRTHTILIWIREAAKKGARRNVLQLLTFHGVLEARVQ